VGKIAEKAVCRSVLPD